MKSSLSSRVFSLSAAVLSLGFTNAVAGRLLIAQGEARAQIVVSETPSRMQQLAATELQAHIEAISGVKLPIVSAPDDALPLRLYVGRSAFTDAYGIDTEGLDHGAFRMHTVPDGLILMGRDEDYVPVEPFTMQRSSAHPDFQRVYAEWDAITGDSFGNPRASFGRSYHGELGIFAYDQRGSLNAVHEFLRGLGVRWYMPGDLGTVMPAMDAIPLPDLNRVVEPAFDWRMVTFATYFSTAPEDVLFYLRQGFNHGNVVGHWSHGLRTVTARREMKEQHPERYALVRGVRLTDRNHACLSSPGLFDAAVRFGRAMFDHYDLPMVSMMPQDGFNFCECALCEGKDTPERGRNGLHSDYVWEFVDRVARELYKTHPDRKVNCLAYGTYRLPPLDIERFSPNVSVGIVHARGRHFDDPKVREELLELRAQWQTKTDNPMWTWEHYLFSQRPPFVPFFFPQAIAKGIRSLADDGFFGEFIEVPIGPFETRGHAMHEPGINHLNLYVTGRLQWDPTLNLERLLDEYYTRFYGPAAADMQAFIEYCEANRSELREQVDKINHAFDLLATAAASAPEGSVHARRIALITEYMQGLGEWRDQLIRGREGVPVTQAPVRKQVELTLDGRLDEAVWAELPENPLVDVRSGEPARTPSWFKIFWDGGEREGHLVVGVRCEEPDMENLRVMTTESGDWRIFNDDNLDVMLGTQSHSYYQIAVNAAGATVDMARTLGHHELGWSSLAQVAAHQGQDYWSIEMRIPVTGEQTPGDPMHELAGWRPSAEAPWHIQIGRQRLRGPDREWSAWSPTGGNFHDIMRFGRLE